MLIKGLFFAALIVILSIIKPISYRAVARNYDLSFSPFFTSVWTGLFIILSFPFLGDGFISDFNLLIASPELILFSIAKGIVSWYTIKISQTVNKKSTSAVVFFPFISLALTSFILNVFLGENLALLQLVPIILLGFLGIGFCFFGVIKDFSYSWKKYFLAAIILSTLCPVLDHLALSKINWFSYFTISNFSTLIFCFCKKNKISDIKKVFANRDIFKAGFFNTLREIVIISSSVSILPVSLVNFSIRLSAPIVMVFSALKYKESSVMNQLIFGILALLAAVPIILFK